MNLQRRNGHHERASHKTKQREHFPGHCWQLVHSKQVDYFAIEKNILDRPKKNESTIISEGFHA